MNATENWNYERFRTRDLLQSAISPIFNTLYNIALPYISYIKTKLNNNEEENNDS